MMIDTILTVWHRFHKLPLLEMIPILVSLFVAVALLVCIFVPLRHPAPRILVRLGNKNAFVTNIDTFLSSIGGVPIPGTSRMDCLSNLP